MEENANKLHFIVSNFVIHPQILIFSVFKIANFAPYWLQIYDDSFENDIITEPLIPGTQQ